jgi:hypothetical protein
MSRVLMSKFACLMARGLTPGPGRDVRVLPDAPRSRARRDHLRRRLQDLPDC